VRRWLLTGKVRGYRTGSRGHWHVYETLDDHVARPQAPAAHNKAPIKEVLNMKDVARRYGVSEGTARDWAVIGRIPAFQVGGMGKWFVRRADLEAAETPASTESGSAA